MNCKVDYMSLVCRIEGAVIPPSSNTGDGFETESTSIPYLKTDRYNDDEYLVNLW